jgi:hypothetical protein
VIVIGRPDAREPGLPPDALAGLLPFQPTLMRTFSSRETLRIYAPISWRAAADTASVTLTLTGSGAPVSRTVSARAASPGEAIRRAAIDEALPLGQFPPGTYILTVTAALSGGKPVTRAVGITVVK